ncbi:MAG: hypothetical protein ACK4NX_00260, partial [Candidatus Paceibacteria bacterium]
LDLTGWSLWTESSGRGFNLSGVLRPDGFLLVKRPDSKLTLRNTGDSIFLKNPENVTTFEVSFKNEIEEGLSAARFDSSWKLTRHPTPGSENILESDFVSIPSPTPTQIAWQKPSSEASLFTDARDSRQIRTGRILFFGGVLGIGAAIFAIILKKRILL